MRFSLSILFVYLFDSPDGTKLEKVGFRKRGCSATLGGFWDVDLPIASYSNHNLSGFWGWILDRHFCENL